MGAVASEVWSVRIDNVTTPPGDAPGVRSTVPPGVGADAPGAADPTAVAAIPAKDVRRAVACCVSCWAAANCAF